MIIHRDESTRIWLNSNPVESLSDYLESIEAVSSTFGNSRTLWFRGQPKYTQKLVPSIYRRTVWSEYSDFKEHEIFKQFKRKSQIENKTDFEYYHLMQHYGCPTRLLDWTESSLIALFFALYDLKICNDPAVYILEPYELNSISTNDRTIYYFYGTEVDDNVKKYFLGPKRIKDLPDIPLAVYPAYYDKRIISQKSCFTIFGKSMYPLEFICKNTELPLAKIRISQNFIEKIQNELFTAGINYSLVMPDLEGLCKEIRVQYGMKL